MKQHSENSERAIIGALLTEPSLIDSLEISSDEMFNPRNRRVLTAMRSVAARGDLLSDVSLLAEELGADVNSMGGISYLTECHGLPTMIESYASNVTRWAVTRSVRQCAVALMESPEAGTELLAHAYELLSPIALDARRDTTKTGIELVREVCRELATLGEQEGASRGLPCGLKELTETLGGLSVGNVTVVAGQTSMGKSSLARTIAEQVLTDTDHGVHLFSMEDAGSTYTYRRLAAESKVGISKMMSLQFQREELSRMHFALEKLEHRERLLIDDQHGLSAQEIGMRVRRHRKPNNTKLIVVDFLQQMHTKEVPRADKRGQADAAMEGLVGIARSEECALIAVSQLSRESSKQQREPQLSDLRESGTIEQSAYAVVFVHADERTDTWRDIIVAKNKNGPIGKFRAEWHGPTTQFMERNA